MAVLHKKHFQIYKKLKKWAGEKEFTAKEAYAFIREHFGRTHMHKVVYILFGREILVASDPVRDNDLRRRGFMHSEPNMISVSPKTFLKFNPDVRIVSVESGGEVKSIDTYLSQCSKGAKEANAVWEKISKDIARLRRASRIINEVYCGIFTS